MYVCGSSLCHIVNALYSHYCSSNLSEFQIIFLRFLKVISTPLVIVHTLLVINGACDEAV